VGRGKKGGSKTKTRTRPTKDSKRKPKVEASDDEPAAKVSEDEPVAEASEDESEAAASEDEAVATVFVSDFFNLTGAVPTTKTLSKADYEEVFMKVVGAFNWDHNTFTDNENDQGRFVGCLLRTAGHDFMDYRFDAKVVETGTA